MKNSSLSIKDGNAVLNFSKQNLIRNICIVCALILAIATVIVFFASFGWGKMTQYPLEQPIESYNPYVEQFDAFMKGQLHLDFEPSEDFLELENPYDPSERKYLKRGDDYLFDRAYYDGKFYSYFGTAPIFTVMLPCYVLTGALPSDAVIQLIYMLLFAVFMTLLVFVVGEKIASRTHPAILAFIAYAANVSSLQMLFGRGYTPFYYIAATSAMAFLAMFAYLFFKGIFAKKLYSRTIFFGLAGLAFALCFHSRVNTAFTAAFFIVPAVLFGIVLKKRELSVADGTSEQKISFWEKYCLGNITLELVSLAFFVVIGFALAFAYNYVRFGSILEFGSNYQLTIAEVSKYELKFSEIGPSVFHYFLSPLKASEETGELNLSYLSFSGLGRALYVDGHFGILNVPFMWFGFATPIFLLGKNKSRLLKYSAVGAFVSCFVIAWVDFCLGGVIYRYLCDFSAIFALLSAIGIILLLERILEMKTVWIKYALISLVIIFVVFSLYQTFRIMAITNVNLLEMEENSVFYWLFATKSTVK